MLEDNKTMFVEAEENDCEDRITCTPDRYTHEGKRKASRDAQGFRKYAIYTLEKKKKIKRGSTQRKKESDEVYTEQWSATKIAELSGKSRMFSILWMWV